MFSKCKCHGKKWCVQSAVFTAGFYVEHILFEKVFPFTILTKLVGV